MKIAATLILSLLLAACSQGPAARMVAAPSAAASAAPAVGMANSAASAQKRYIA